ncbi:hypothetical protein COV19_07255 [Candidatus Woesearchaeota archaeon CG10_big_fil_rev_8_21_14_0_10_44_13]|nr:MAG: hypothetical protein COV19_07255 [Candidatus Woesearchaeota archaeon CG10_big_fil_rev_8_21_14_0_10_44_13]
MPNRYADPWKGFAKRWDEYYTAPGRPTRDEVRIFLNYIKKSGKLAKGKKSKIKVLVLGATPELRDMLARIKADVSLIDVSKYMIREMTKLRKTRSKEHRFTGNWLKMPFSGGYFDIVVGDLAQGNIPKNKKDIFLAEISRVLKKEGYFIHRIFHMPEHQRYVNPERIFGRYSRYKYSKQLHMGMFMDLLYNTYNKKTNITDTAIMKGWISKYMYSPGKFRHPDRQISKLLERAYVMWQPFKKKWCTFPEKDIAKMMERHFIIMDNSIRTGSHRMAETFRIWSLKKR